MNSRHRTGAVLATVAYGFFSIIVGLSEMSLIPLAQRGLYLDTKAALGLSAFCLAYYLYKDYESVIVNSLIVIHCIIYSVHGQLHRPLYYFSFIQLATSVAFFLVVPKVIFRVGMVVWTAAFTAVFYFKWEQFCNQMQQPVFSDIVLAILAAAMIAMVGHAYYTEERMFRAQALARFTEIGIHSSRLIHDLKGLTSAPKIYAQLLKSKLMDHEDASVKEVLDGLEGDLKQFERIVFELNQISSSRTENIVTEFDLQDIVDSVTAILGNRIRDVQVDIQKPIWLRMDRSKFTSLMLNIFLNSIEQMKQAKTIQPRIVISFEGGVLSVCDNGGGFSLEVLRSIRNRSSVSTKINGSGLGLWMVMDVVDGMGGSVAFENVADGAVVRLKLPRRVIFT